jgi:hypothetical protein
LQRSVAPLRCRPVRAEVAEWQTRWIQNPVSFTGCVGSTPTFGTFRRADDQQALVQQREHQQFRSASAIFQHPLHGGASEFAGVRDAQFVFDVLAVRVDRVRADEELVGNGARRQALANQVEDL